MKRADPIVFCVLFLTLKIAFASPQDPNVIRNNKIDCSFLRKEGGYRFNGKFLVKAEASCAILTIYDPKNVKSFLGEKYIVDILEQGKDYYVLSYKYKSPLFEIRSIYKKSLRLIDNVIEFEMINFWARGFIPHVNRSIGRYKIAEEKEGLLISYSEETETQNNWFEFMNSFIAKQEIERILTNVQGSIQNLCPSK